MYATRQATGGNADENHKAEKRKAAADKGATAGRVATGHAPGNRRALGDIGNLVTRMATRCQLKGDAEAKGKDLCGLSSTRQIPADRPAKLKSLKSVTFCSQTSEGPLKGELPSDDGALGQVFPEPWGTKKRRSHAGQPAETKEDGTVRDNTTSGLANNAVETARESSAAPARPMRVLKERIAADMPKWMNAMHEDRTQMRDDALPDTASGDKDGPRCLLNQAGDIPSPYSKTEVGRRKGSNGSCDGAVPNGIGYATQFGENGFEVYVSRIPPFQKAKDVHFDTTENRELVLSGGPAVVGGRPVRGWLCHPRSGQPHSVVVGQSHAEVVNMCTSDWNLTIPLPAGVSTSEGVAVSFLDTGTVVAIVRCEAVPGKLKIITGDSDSEGSEEDE